MGAPTEPSRFVSVDLSQDMITTSMMNDDDCGGSSRGAGTMTHQLRDAYTTTRPGRSSGSGSTREVDIYCGA